MFGKKIILSTHQKGGVGKSTLSFNLANNISKEAKVCIIDFDPQGSLSQLNHMVNNFDILPYDDNINEIENLEYDFIFIDTPPYLSENLPHLIQIATLILVPTKAGILDLLAIKSTLDIIKKENSKEKTLIVFNMVKPNTNLTEEIVNGMEDYQIPIAKTFISDLVSFTRSVLVGNINDNSKAQNQLDNLTEEILTKIVQENEV